MGGEGPRALPAQLVEGARLAHLVVLLLHHVEHVALGSVRRHLAVGVVRADDVQVVVDVNFHRVLVPQEPAGEERGDREEEVTDGCSGFFFIFKRKRKRVNKREGCVLHTRPGSQALTAHQAGIIRISDH